MEIIEIITWIFVGAAWVSAAFVALLLWWLGVVAKATDEYMGRE